MSGQSEEEPLPGSTEMQALCRLAEPLMPRIQPPREEVWATRYRIVDLIGQGGMGDVFLCRDLVLDRLVALKVVRATSDESFVDDGRLLHEARAAAQAEHERIARVYDAGIWRDQAFIAMEYVRGETLRVWMKTYQATRSEIIAIVQQLLEGLQALHERGLVHRDLKPENVMVTADGTLRILDLGVARRVPIADVMSEMAEAGGISLGFGVGTPGYMAPEQWKGPDTDARVDLFALGVVAYELIAGRPPFRGSTNREIREQTLKAELSFDGPKWADMPAELVAAVRKALLRDRRHRFQSVQTMAEALAPLFRPVPPPLSRRRAPTIRPPGDDRPPAESLAASAIERPFAVPPRRPIRRVALGTITILLGLLTRGHWAQRSVVPPPPGDGMVRVLGGSYRMGLSAQQVVEACAKYAKACPQIQTEAPARATSLETFDLDVHEVTNEEFAKFLTIVGPSVQIEPDADEHYLRYVRYRLRRGDDFVLYDGHSASSGIDLSSDGPFRAKAGYERLPVTQVTWLGARLYCKNANKRLPTESEWELAARGLDDRPFPWGWEPPSCKGVHIPGNGTLAVVDPDHCDNDRDIPFPIMSAPQDVTRAGVHDLGGNVVEWVDDDAFVGDEEASYASRLFAEKPAFVRGGAFNSSFYTRTTAHSHRLAFYVGQNLGFRCAKSISPGQ